jgi:GTP-binding protein
MDSNPLERERGITILSKNCAIQLHQTAAASSSTSTSSTPRATPTSAARSSACSCMADGALLVVDSVEGPMPQTRFVLGKALAAGAQAHRRGQQDGPP